MALLTLPRSRAARPEPAHPNPLADRIGRYRSAAARALANAQHARRHGNELHARGLVDEAQCFLALAEGLADQARTQSELDTF